jgi:hypothetical protein
MRSCREPDVPAPDAVPNAGPQALPLLRHGPEGATWTPPAETVVIHPARDVDQTKRATADAVTGKRRQAGMDLLIPVRRLL